MDTNDILVIAGRISKHIHDNTESSVDAELVAYMIHRGMCAENDMRVAEEYEKTRRKNVIVHNVPMFDPEMN